MSMENLYTNIFFLLISIFIVLGIIYCLSRKDCGELANKLRDHGINAAPYHAELDPAERQSTQAKWR